MRRDRARNLREHVPVTDHNDGKFGRGPPKHGQNAEANGHDHGEDPGGLGGERWIG